MDVRPFTSADRDGCLAVFDSNVPEYLDPRRREAFSEHLANPPGPYFVMEHDGAIAGCGGYAEESLNWILVRRDLHRNGLGRFLTFLCLKKLSAERPVSLVRVDTAAAGAAFFEKQGFRPARVLADGRLEMIKKLEVCG